MAKRRVAAIILAAGKSTRMNSELPKVLYPVCGRPMLAYVIDACRQAGAQRICVVVGHCKNEVIDAFKDDQQIDWVEQREQLGTGHAVMACAQMLGGFVGDVLVIAGDMPLVRGETLSNLLQAHQSGEAAISVASSELDDPAGYGRIIRDDQDRLQAIVEQNNCTEQQKSVKEVNISYYCFDCEALFGALKRVTPDDHKGEYFITDAVRILTAQGRPSRILAHVAPQDALGVNSLQDLQGVEEVLQQRLAHCEPH